MNRYAYTYDIAVVGGDARQRLVADELKKVGYVVTEYAVGGEGAYGSLYQRGIPFLKDYGLKDYENSEDYENYTVSKFNGEKIGYVPRKDNHVLSNLMDGGKQLYGIVESIGVKEVYENDFVKFLKFKIFLNEQF